MREAFYGAVSRDQGLLSHNLFLTIVNLYSIQRLRNRNAYFSHGFRSFGVFFDTAWKLCRDLATLGGQQIVLYKLHDMYKNKTKKWQDFYNNFRSTSENVLCVTFSSE